jgi:hypothetical protein
MILEECLNKEFIYCGKGSHSELYIPFRGLEKSIFYKVDADIDLEYICIFIPKEQAISFYKVMEVCLQNINATGYYNDVLDLVYAKINAEDVLSLFSDRYKFLLFYIDKIK